MIFNTVVSGGSGGGVETVVGTISAGKYGLSVNYSDGNSYMSGYWSGTDIGSGSITVLKNSIIIAFSDSDIQISGGISAKNDISAGGYSNTYFVSGDFSLTGY